MQFCMLPHASEVWPHCDRELGGKHCKCNPCKASLYFMPMLQNAGYKVNFHYILSNLMVGVLLDKLAFGACRHTCRRRALCSTIQTCICAFPRICTALLALLNAVQCRKFCCMR